MEHHQDLRIEGNAEAGIAALIAAGSGSSEWARRVKEEERVRGMGGGRQLCFANESLTVPCFVFLRSDQSVWELSTVVFIDNDAHDEEQESVISACNRAVQSFHAWASPILARAGALISLSGADQSPRDWLNPDLAQLLDLAVANGYPCHPCDSERWNEVVIGAHRGGLQMAPGQLRDWLIQDREWDAEDADRLATVYEHSRELLRAYDQAR